MKHERVTSLVIVASITLAIMGSLTFGVSVVSGQDVPAQSYQLNLPYVAAPADAENSQAVNVEVAGQVMEEAPTESHAMYFPLIEADGELLDEADTIEEKLELAPTPEAATTPVAVSFPNSLRFFGHTTDDIDRVKIAIDNPARPVDVGATDFTIEFWLKAEPGVNLGRATCNRRDGWLTGNIVLDRDVYYAGDYGDFGIALNNGRIAFGVSVGTKGTTVCGAKNVADGRWHHVAVTRRVNGALAIFVDGAPDGSRSGTGGNASYRDGRATSFANDPYIVLGAQKFSEGPAYPSFSGWLDEVRVSRVRRYSSQFIPPSSPFSADANTVGLYHFDEGSEGPCAGVILDAVSTSGGPSHGECRYGGSGTAGPVYSADSPFSLPPTPTPTSTATPTATPTSLPTATWTPQPTATNTAVPPTATWTAQPTVTSTAVPPTATWTAQPTVTSTAVPPTATWTAQPTATWTPLPIATNTPVPPTATWTPLPTATNTPVPPTATWTPLPTATNTPVPPTATWTPLPTATNTPVPPTATWTPLPTATNTPVPPTATWTPLPTATNTPVPPTATWTPLPTATNTPVPPTATWTPLPTATNTPMPPTATLVSGRVEKILVGDGYTDVSPKALVRSAENRLFVVVSTCNAYPCDNLAQTLRLYRANTTGIPSSFTREDSTREPAGVSQWAIAIDGNDVIHVAYNTRSTNGGPVTALRYVTFDTTANQWSAVETIDSAISFSTDSGGQGMQSIALALDGAGNPHIVYLAGANRRAYYRNRIGASWSGAVAIDGDVTYAGSQKAWHPNLAFDSEGRILVAWERGTFNGANDGTIFFKSRNLDGTWSNSVNLSGNNGARTIIDQSTSLLVTSDNRYHIAWISAPDDFIRYQYSDDLGKTWLSNYPSGSWQVTHNPSLGLNGAGGIRLYGHCPPIPSPDGYCGNLFYMDSTGGPAAWSQPIPYVAGNFDSSVNTRWAQYFNHYPQILDIAYWADPYPNVLYVGSEIVTP